MKNRIPLFVVMGIAAVILALGCRLPGSQSKGTSLAVDVSLNAGAARAGRSLIGDDNVDTVSVEVLNSKAEQIGLGNLAKGESYWHGKISVSETGLLTFHASAMDVYLVQLYFGTATATLTGSNDPPVTIPVDRVYYPGETGPAGGFIFYDKGSYSDGWRYLEAAPSDQSTGIQWWNGEYTTTGASGTAVGTGAANTTAIIDSQGEGSYAARLCADLVVGIYDDWFLPSLDELNMMFISLEVPSRCVFADGWYWSSSEYYYDNHGAWGQSFGGGHLDSIDKNEGFCVRAARAF